MGIFGQNQPGQPRYSGELHNLSVTESVFGTVAPIVFGTTRVHQKMLFYGGFYAVTAPSSGGKGIFGGKSTAWDYYADTLMLLAQGSASGGCHAVLNVWDQQGKLENETQTYSYTIPSSSPTVIPSTSPSVGADQGVYTTSSYSVTANDYGSGGSKTLTGTQQIAFTRVDSSPGAGEYSFNATTGAYTFSTADHGTVVTISYSLVFSLYYYEQTQAAVVPSSPYQVSTDNQSFFYQDLQVTRVDTGALVVEGAGTNGYTESGGVYTFTSDLEGVYVYIDYEYTSSDPDITSSSTLNLTFFSGTQGQAPWSYMTSKYPGSNFGYSALCYLGANPLYLGESASMPSYNYELMGLEIFGGGVIDSHPCDALLLLLTDPLLGVGFPSANVDTAWQRSTAAATGPNAYAYWAANNYFISVSLNTQQPAADALRQVIETGNVAAVWSGGLLKLIPYGDATAVSNGYTFTPPTTPVATLEWSDLLAPSEHSTGDSVSDDPIQVSVKAPQDCMNYVQAQWMNRANSYNEELTPEQNDAYITSYGFRPESPQTWDFITTQTAATWALNLRLKRNCYIRNTYKIWLPFWFAALEPMDMLVLPTGEPVRITSIEDDPEGRLAIEAEQWSYGTADVTLYTKEGPASYQPNVSQAIPGNSVPIFVQNTTQQNAGSNNILQIAASGQNPNWGGCNAYVSLDNMSYTLLGKVTSPGVIGLLSTSLPSSADPDTTDTLSVDITIGAGGNVAAQLVSVSQLQADQLVTLSAIVDVSGSNELISYETASLTAANRYDLTYLRRGCYGSAVASHDAGAWFAYLGAGYDFLDYQYATQNVGQTLYVKLQSFNLAGGQLQDLSQCVVWTFILGGQGSDIVETYVPSGQAVTEIGTGTVTNASNAYDKNFATYATLATGLSASDAKAEATFDTWPSETTTKPMTLYINYQNLFVSQLASPSGMVSFIAIVSGVQYPFMVVTSTTGGTYATSGTASWSIPIGTDLTTLGAYVAALNQIPPSSSPSQASVDINEVWIQ